MNVEGGGDKEDQEENNEENEGGIFVLNENRIIQPADIRRLHAARPYLLSRH